MLNHRYSLTVSLMLCAALVIQSCGTPRERSNALVRSATLEILESQQLLQKAESAPDAGANKLRIEAEQKKDMALKHFEEAIALDSTNIDAFWNYGLVNQSLQYIEDALANFERGYALVLATNPPPYGVDKFPDQAVRDSLKNVYNGFVLQLYTCNKMLKRYEKALQYASDPFFRNFYPSKFAEGAEAFAFDLLQKKEYDRSIEQFKVAQNASRDARTAEGRQVLYKAAYYIEQAHRGKAGKENLPDYQAIIEAYETTISIDSENPESYSRLATICDEAGEKGVKGMEAKALDIYKAAIAKNPKSEMLRNNYGLLLVKKGRVPEGVSQFKEILKLNPNSVDSYQNLGVIYEQTGNRGEAINAYKKFLELARNDPSKANDIKVLTEKLNKMGVKL